MQGAGGRAGQASKFDLAQTALKKTWLPGFGNKDRNNGWVA